MKSPVIYKVLPSALAEQLRSLALTVHRPVQGPGLGSHRSPHLGSSVEFAEYRQYTRGDPIQRIDWSVFARSDRYMIRRFHEETNLKALVLLDSSESMAFQGQGPMTKIEYGARLAAAFLFILVNQGDVAGLVTFDSMPKAVFPPAGTFEGLRPMLLYLDDIKGHGRSDIEASIHAAALAARSRSLVLIVSDFLQAPDALSRGLHRLNHDGHDVTLFHVMDGSELTLELAGVTELRELETGQRLVIDADEVRNAYRVQVERHIERLRRACADCQARHILVDTRTPIEVAVHKRAVRT